jgi:hypothetical protein
MILSCLLLPPPQTAAAAAALLATPSQLSFISFELRHPY